MSELYNDYKYKTNFISFLTSNLILLYSFIISHLLYFSYFIFFSPYLFKLFSFLSPLFITTFLLFSTCQFNLTLCVPSLHPAYTLGKSQKEDNENGEFHCFADLELYEIVFGDFLVGFEENPPQVFVEIPGRSQKSGLNVQGTGKKSAEMEGKRHESFLNIVDMFERMSCSSMEEKKKIEPPKTSEVGEKQNVESIVLSCGSERKSDESLVKSKIRSYSQRVGYSMDYNENGFKNYGSMRKEKEWKRTLACKLFEERHNVEATDGMDSLWETYEKNEPKPKSNKNEKMMMKKKKIDVHEDYDEFESEYEGQLCCLQAFKLSAGKMNLGMKKPNLVKFSKVVKGIGWLSHLSKNNKKVHNNGDRFSDCYVTRVKT